MMVMTPEAMKISGSPRVSWNFQLKQLSPIVFDDDYDDYDDDDDFRFHHPNRLPKRSARELRDLKVIQWKSSS